MAENSINKYKFTFIDCLGKIYKRLNKKVIEVVPIVALENKKLRMLIEDKIKIVSLYTANKFGKKYFS
jgi:hypothetical protein